MSVQLPASIWFTICSCANITGCRLACLVRPYPAYFKVVNNRLKRHYITSSLFRAKSWCLQNQHLATGQACHFSYIVVIKCACWLTYTSCLLQCLRRPASYARGSRSLLEAWHSLTVGHAARHA